MRSARSRVVRVLARPLGCEDFLHDHFMGTRGSCFAETISGIHP